jgi:hypothetical protein
VSRISRRPSTPLSHRFTKYTNAGESKRGEGGLAHWHVGTPGWRESLNRAEADFRET